MATKPLSEMTSDGKRTVYVDIAEDVTGSGLVAGWLKRSHLTQLAQLFMEYCKVEMSEI